MAEKFEVLWSRSAVNDLDEILDYLAEEASIDRALDLYEKVRGQVASLSRLPRRCRYVPELKAVGLTEFREAILPPYRIFFRLVDDRVILLGILDGRRDLEELLIQRALELDDS
ncbi:MAG: type II toxin-antitoxin system RelE/ParE family toxin [bacterium]|nr:type II toxin-antitoxin system RelE/ParE family toxin [bacterium]